MSLLSNIVLWSRTGFHVILSDLSEKVLIGPGSTNSNPHTPSILRKQAATSFPDQPDKLKKAFLALAVSHFVFRPMVLIHLESEGNLRTFCIKHPHLSLGNKQLAIL